MLPTDLQREVDRAKEDDAINNPDVRALASLDSEHKKMLIMESWLKGQTPKEIANLLSIDYIDLKRLLEEARVELREIQSGQLLDLTAERVEGFRLIKREAWSRLGSTWKAPHNLLNTLLRVEEDIAKIQGVLSENVRHSGGVDLNLKLYDFDEGGFPEPIDTTFKVVKPEALPETNEQEVTDYDSWAADLFSSSAEEAAEE